MVFRSKPEIRFDDADALGHVNNARYLTLIEQARISFFDHFFGKEIRYTEEGVIVASASIDYLEPVKFRDILIVETWCSRIGNKSFVISYSGFKNDAGVETPVFKAETTLVCFDYKVGSSILIKDEWRKVLERIPKPDIP